MSKKSKKEYAGFFEIKSGKVIVSDPCYERNTWCQGVIDKVKNGEWEAYLYIFDEGEWGKRVGYLLAHHQDNTVYPTDSNWEKQDFEVGVDSGQAGIYDEAEYHGGEDDYGQGGWYDINCNLTCDRENGTTRNGGVLEGGVVSCSGYGDGGYDCRTITKDGEVVGILIDFGLDDFWREDEEELEDEIAAEE